MFYWGGVQKQYYFDGNSLIVANSGLQTERQCHSNAIALILAENHECVIYPASEELSAF